MRKLVTSLFFVGKLAVLALVATVPLPVRAQETLQPPARLPSPTAVPTRSTEATAALQPPITPQPPFSPQPPTPMELRLAARTAEQPNRASNWRLLSRLRLRRGEVHGAIDAGWQAVNLDPRNVSAQFDLAQAWLAAEDLDKARYHFQLAQSIAPESEYAQQASYQLVEVDRRQAAKRASAAEAERRPNRFAGTPLIQDSKPGSPLVFEVELGVIHNSNVQLAPISRVAGSPGLGSMQGFAAPQLEWELWQADAWSAGVNFDGYFNVNDEAHSDFNLQDYQPGWFIERSVWHGDSEWIGRLEYDYTLDLFAGDLFGQRHSITTLLEVIRAGSESTVYWTIDRSDFEDDGATPGITSQDGWTNTLGGSHTFLPQESVWDSVRIGLDLQWAPLQGKDAAYRGLFLYAEGEILLPACWVLGLQSGWGYRDFPDFTGSPDRNETLWRAGVDLRRELGAHWEIAAVLTYDRFASENSQYDTDRTMAGVTTTFRR